MIQRTKHGTFQKGASGNPSGRPKSESVELRKALAAKAEDIVNVVVEAARNGDIQAAKIILDRVCPPLKPSSAPVVIDLPERPGVAEMARAIIEHAASGDISADIAGQLVRSVADMTSLLEVDELERRLKALEESQ